RRWLGIRKYGASTWKMGSSGMYTARKDEAGIGLTFDKCDAAANPFPVLVEVNSNHFSLTEAGEIDGQGGTGSIVRPEIHQPDLRFGGYIRGRDQVGIPNLTLQDPVSGVADFEVRKLRIDDYALAREREKRFQDVVLQIRGRLAEFAEEKGFRRIRMVDKGECVFAYAIKPARVGNPMNGQVVPDIDMRAELTGRLVELVKNDPVIDPADMRSPAGEGMVVIKMSSFADQFRQANRLNAQVVAGAIKIDAGLLPVGPDLQQDYLFGRTIADDRVFQEVQV